MSDTATTSTPPAGDTAESGAPSGSSTPTPPPPRRLRRRILLGLALVVTGLVAVDAVTVVSLLGARSTHHDLRYDRAEARDATRRMQARLGDLAATLATREGELDAAVAAAAAGQEQLTASLVALGGAQTASASLQGRIDALNRCIDGVHQTLFRLAAGDRAGAVGTLRLISPVCNAGVGATGGANPVLAFDFPDPFVLRVGTTYYAYATNAGGGDVQIAQSDDFREWSLVGNALGALPGWASPNRTWAPSVLPRLGPFGAYYVLYYTVATRGGPACISRAAASSPTGPFVDDSLQPLVCPPNGDAIDPSPFVDPNGAAYLTWRGEGARIWSQPLDAGGLALSGEPHALIGPDQAWEHGVVEGPALLAVPGRYYLFYSANQWNSRDYAVGYAACDTPLGPCRKPQAAPIFSSIGAIAGPGGQELFSDAAGGLFIAYHAYTDPNVGYPYSRRLHLLPVAFDAAGVPVLRPPGL